MSQYLILYAIWFQQLKLLWILSNLDWLIFWIGLTDLVLSKLKFIWTELKKVSDNFICLVFNGLTKLSAFYCFVIDSKSCTSSLMRRMTKVFALNEILTAWNIETIHDWSVLHVVIFFYLPLFIHEIYVSLRILIKIKQRANYT